jgi:hypothetical protein
VIEGNNIYGNLGLNHYLVNIPDPGNTANCGLVNTGDTYHTPTPVPLDAKNNYWGASAGPGSDPADTAGTGCDFNGGQTIFKPFATAMFGLSPTANSPAE